MIMAVANRTTLAQPVPHLKELASDWMDVSTLRNFPSVMNATGGLQTTENLTGFQNLTAPPFAQGRSVPYSWAEGIRSSPVQEQGDCEWLINGRPVSATFIQWLPFGVRRKTRVNGISINSFIRMPYEQKGVLERVVLNNESDRSRTFIITMRCLGRMRHFPPEVWRTWENVRPSDSNYVASVVDGGKSLVIKDRSSDATMRYSFVAPPTTCRITGCGGDVNWAVTLAPGKQKLIEWECVVTDQTDSMISDLNTDGAKFNNSWDAACTESEKRWQAAFTPSNNYFSGHLPVLVTEDRKIRRVYYMGALTPLLMCRTGLPLSARCYVTAGPQWANTLTYFWDAEMWANSWAMLDPVIMKQQLQKWLSIDFHQCYAVDWITGKGAGPWYAANDWSVFRCVEAYISVTGDNSFLSEMVDNKTVLQHLYDIATYYETRPLTPGNPLADYGGPQNLLECSPSYIQGVSSLNAANVYMLRKTASYFDASLDQRRASELRARADRLLPAVLSLYVPGQGVWNAMDSKSRKVPIRHCYDYIVIGQALENDLTTTIKTEMNHFVTSELLTDTWMRAMSLKDPAAGKSDRPDHGPMGSYDAWPPMTMDVLCRFGEFNKAITFLRAAESVTHLGSWAQAHEFTGPNSRGNSPIVQTASRGGQDANEGCGAAFAEVIIRSFFGFRPDLSSDEPVLLSPHTPRNFRGKLKHLLWKKKSFMIVSDSGGVRIHAE
jgi:hypothetical protein